MNIKHDYKNSLIKQDRFLINIRLEIARYKTKIPQKKMSVLALLVII